MMMDSTTKIIAPNAMGVNEYPKAIQDLENLFSPASRWHALLIKRIIMTFKKKPTAILDNSSRVIISSLVPKSLVDKAVLIDTISIIIDDRNILLYDS